MKISYWFAKKEFDGAQREFALLYEPTVLKKTEKAVFLEWNIPGRGGFRCWAPKTAVSE